MKKLSKLTQGTQLSREQMKKVKGGDSSHDYCCSLIIIIAHNWQNWDVGTEQGAEYGWSLCFDSNTGVYPGGHGFDYTC